MIESERKLRRHPNATVPPTARAGVAASATGLVRVRTRVYARARDYTWAVALACAQLLAWAPVAPAAPPPGTAVPNTASASQSGSAAPPIASNTVTTIVQALEWLELDGGARAAVAPGGSNAFRHRLWNRGNTDASVELAVANLGLDAFDATLLGLTWDADRDGAAGAGDVLLLPGVRLAVAAGDSADLLLALGAPAQVAAGSEARVRLTASSLLASTAAAEDTLAVVDAGALFAEKSASRRVVEHGELLEWTVSVANRTGAALAGIVVHDRLPAGFAFVAGSARRDAVPQPDPAGGAGPQLRFALGDLAPDAVVTLSYRTRVGPGAPLGTATNVAAAEVGAWRSNDAVAEVRVRPDPFREGATVLGTVTLSTPRAGGEPVAIGLAGVRVWLDDGTFAVTDERGRYSLTGLTPRTHALKLDRTTLPEGARPIAVDARDAGTPGLRMVDLARGLVERADFAVVGDSAVEIRAIERRLIAAGRDEAARALARAANGRMDPPAEVDPRTRPASGITTGEPRAPIGPPAPLAGGPGSAVRPALPEAAPLEHLIRTVTRASGFMGLADGDTLTESQLAVRVKGRIGSRLVLRVNGAEVPESRVGNRVTAPWDSLEAWEYVGVALAPGANRLELAVPGAPAVGLTVVAPGPFARLALETPRRAAAGEGAAATVRVRALDAAGLPVRVGLPVTLESTAGSFAARDLDPAQAGLQVALVDGHAEVTLLAPAEAVEARVTVAAGELRAAAGLSFVPEPRPLVIVGSAEGVLAVRGRARGTTPVDRTLTTFETPIVGLAGRADEPTSAEARATLFVKGRIADATQLTVGVDTDRPADLPPYRDADPDRVQPVFGDAAVRGYEAQSAGKLYVQLERPDASLRYGDFTAGSGGPQRLSNYARVLTGARASWGDARGSLQAFTSRERSRRAVEELPGRGISGPYQLGAGGGIVPHSERVEIVVRERDRPAVVRSATLRQRFTDYELDPLTGRLLFRFPVPSLDAELNPVFVRVSYELEDGGEAAWVHGVEARARVREGIELGGSWVDDHDPLEPWRLRGLSSRLSLGAHSGLELEWAASRRLAGHAGGATAAAHAGRFELRHDGARAQARLWGAGTAAEFDNPGAGIGAGRQEAGGRLSARLAERTRLNAEALYSADAGGGVRRGGVLLALDRTLSQALRGELGVRVTGETRASGPAEPTRTALRARLAAQLPRRPDWSGFAEVEQDARDWDGHRVVLGGEHRLDARARVYARHELASSMAGEWTLASGTRRHATLVGVDAGFASEAHAFGEYRMSDALSGRDAQAAVGLRNVWRLEQGLRAGVTFERVDPVGGDTPAEGSTALAGSLEWTDDPALKGSIRMELRAGDVTDQVLQSMALAVRLDSAWVGLARNLLSWSDTRRASRDLRDRLQVALARRDPGTGLDALARWELRFDREQPDAGLVSRRVANVVGAGLTARLGPAWTGGAAWAGKLTHERDGADVYAGGGQWLHGRVRRAFGPRWDAGVSVSALAGRRLSDRVSGLGVEVARSLPGGAWLSAGFNHFGYEDEELTGEEWTRQGAFVRLRLRFDETMLPRPEVTP